jgi:hypothetical protein
LSQLTDRANSDALIAPLTRDSKLERFEGINPVLATPAAAAAAVAGAGLVAGAGVGAFAAEEAADG